MSRINVCIFGYCSKHLASTILVTQGGATDGHQYDVPH